MNRSRSWKLLVAGVAAIVLGGFGILSYQDVPHLQRDVHERLFLDGNKRLISVRQESRLSANLQHTMYLDELERELFASGWKEKEFQNVADVIALNTVSQDLYRVITISAYSDLEGVSQYEVQFAYTQVGGRCLSPPYYLVDTKHRNISQLKEILEVTFRGEPYFIQQAENLPCEDARKAVML